MNKEIPKIIKKEERDALREFANSLRAVLGSKVVNIVLFGSKVRGESREESDIDVLVILKSHTPRERELIYKALIEIELKYDFEPGISPIVYTEEEINKQIKMNTPFISTVLSEGVSLI